MPQFAVITRSFRRLAASEPAGDFPAIRMNLEQRSQSVRCVFEKPQAYLISAADAGAAMSLVQRFASSVGIELIVHRAVEVCCALPCADELPELVAKRE
ncbi:MAG TPA: hypothetical protein VN727_07105 [Candidatus Binatia bacterium]|nr:hypothetical protein [Candidatus Binatia bacterium]